MHDLKHSRRHGWIRKGRVRLCGVPRAPWAIGTPLINCGALMGGTSARPLGLIGGPLLAGVNKIAEVSRK